MKYFCLIPIMFLISCSLPDTTADEQAIREILRQDQQAHLQKNVELLLSNSALDFIEVNRGLVKKPTHEDTTARFSNYFNSVNFIKWEDTADPIIRFSEDRLMAYTILQKEVITTPITNLSVQPDTTEFTWISVMRKVDGKWKVECIASTNKN